MPPKLHASFGLLAFLQGLQVASAAVAPVLPPPDESHASYILPIGGGIAASARPVVLDELNQLGRGSLYHRAGWANVYQPWSGGDIMGALHLADSLDLHLGVIFHHRPARAYAHLVDTLKKKDIREFSWRQNGKTWSEGTLNGVAMSDGRNVDVPSESRLAPDVRRCTDTMIAWWGRELSKGIKAYPGRVAAVNYVVEEELPTAGEQTDSLLGDYSPFSVTEFRDWLRHTGIYDDSSGAHKGEGAPESIVGTFVKTGTYSRSPFYFDPAPNKAAGNHPTFDQTFGTGFTQWKLAYWDLDSFPAPITDTNTNLSPTSGKGAIPGGFDAPRHRDVASRYWNAWSWDVLDHGTATTGQPALSGSTPAFGFRQVSVKHFVDDIEQTLRNLGIPPGLLFHHQIPGEIVGAGRLRSSGSPVWTGRSMDGHTVGITHFGSMDPALTRRWLDTTDFADAGWGIFEWHPLPGTGANAYVDSAHRYSAALLKATIGDLDKYNTSRCRVLFPGWWSESGQATDINWAIYALPNSNFAVGIKTWRDTVRDVPFQDRGVHVESDYAAPAPLGLVQDSSRAGRTWLSWQDTLWSGMRARAQDWKGFGRWRLSFSPDGATWKDTTTTTPRISVPQAGGSFRVRLESSTGVAGAWSPVLKGTGVRTRVVPGWSLRRVDGIWQVGVDQAGPGIRVSLRDARGRLLARGTTDENGNFLLPAGIRGPSFLEVQGVWHPLALP